MSQILFGQKIPKSGHCGMTKNTSYDHATKQKQMFYAYDNRWGNEHTPRTHFLPTLRAICPQLKAVFNGHVFCTIWFLSSKYFVYSKKMLYTYLSLSKNKTGKPRIFSLIIQYKCWTFLPTGCMNLFYNCPIIPPII